MFKRAEQPQSIIETLSASYELFLDVFKTVIPVILAVELLLVFFQYLAQPAGPAQSTAFMPHGPGWLIIPIVVFYLLKVIINAFTLYVADDSASGRELSIEGPMKKAVAKAIPIVIATLIVGIAAFIGTLLFVLPGLFVIIMFALFIPAITLDDKSPIDALKYSWTLVWNNFLQTVGVLLSVIVAIMVVSFVIGLIFAFLPGLISYLGFWLYYSVIAAFYPCLLYVLYNDLKLRAQQKPETTTKSAEQSSDQQ